MLNQKKENIMLKNLLNHFKKSPQNYADILLWCSILFTAPIFYYYTGRVILQLIIVFIGLFVFLEGIDFRRWRSASLQWNFTFQPLRLLVAIPIYFGLFGIIPFLNELVFFPPTF